VRISTVTLLEVASIPDLLVAAIAEAAGLAVLHDDKDFELISEITGQELRRLGD
jgi:predicted nucleic acid-binding protein